MKLTASVSGTTLTLRLTGELDHHAAGEIMRQIEDKLEVELPRDLILDLGGLTFMDSSGIAVILKTHRSMNGLGGRMRIVNVPDQPLRVLDASGIDRMIGISALTGAD